MYSITSLTTVAVAFFVIAPSVLAGKRGIAWPWYNERTHLDPGKLIGDNVQWMYNWETWRPGNTNGFNWIGTQATMDSPSSPVGQLKARAEQQGWNTVFSLNEPDINGISPVTEFALQRPANRDQQLWFLKAAMEFMDHADYVAMYSVFVASSPSLISRNMGGEEVGIGSSLYNDDGSLTDNGWAYRNDRWDGLTLQLQG
ncbi:hypothetical protein FRC09_002907 [Ceratobasidium sp. 395]|nr:hypothetical protein FRC09_002907 [Ceratobasidium sp. 395]